MKKQSHSWWFEGHNSPKRSQWLQSTLIDLDEKTKAMLKVIEEDADSFAQRAEMYYKKRPELINMVEDFYRAHRSLAERFDQVKPDSCPPRVLTTPASPFSFTRFKPEKLTNIVDQPYDCYSETFDPEEFNESEVDDPEHEEDDNDDEIEEEEVSSKAVITANDEETIKLREEMVKLREEAERLKEENRIQKGQLMQKDEEKREVIRQLSLAVELLKDENVELRKKCIAIASAREESNKKWKSPLEFNKLKGMFLGKLFNNGSSSKHETSVVAL